MPGVAETVDLPRIKLGYYGGMRNINPSGIIPLGPELDFSAPHDRGQLASPAVRSMPHLTAG
jgi:putative glutathione S-transferase